MSLVHHCHQIKRSTVEQHSISPTCPAFAGIPCKVLLPMRHYEKIFYGTAVALHDFEKEEGR